ncbi:DUF2332 domain-containing protein [Cognatiyoonia sp. IB215446]|uniref:DUF2332 domain-containing protein n=1 Tax=Cognatiyoonia sp. IB215446 TaxID=3097355 RepID=UPI002A0D96B3|nr:DUF2332 domain-containing protein [Cognatiyoonia sp. IB215446]MDX8347996.1 DUF2332 domain-containing protein [Cognatiyoonia sp. IB215446]
MSSAFAFQAKACSNLGSPFMERLMRACATMPWPAGTIRDRIFGWTGNITASGQSVPLRLAGALHALHLHGHDVLAAVYPPHEVSDGDLWRAVCMTLVADADHIDHWLNSAPQTNEVRRSVALIAVGHWLAERYGLPMRTSELGASAGLNLNWHRYAMVASDAHFGAADPVLTLRPDWDGPLPPASAPRVVAQGGVDLNPLDPHVHALRLQSYLWPDQPHRLELTKAAIAAADTQVVQGDAVDWLKDRLPHVAGQLHLIYSTVAWQYFPAEKQEEGTALIAEAGAAATKNTPLAWFGMENDGSGRGAALTLRLWPGDLFFDLGRADFHGRWVKWAPEQRDQHS